MVADVKIYRYIGAGPTGSDITSTNVRCATKDISSTNDTTYPIVIPAAAGGGLSGGDYNYSYAVWYRLFAHTAPATSLGNIKWYVDAANNLGSQVSCWVKTTSTYAQATGGTEGITGALLGSTAEAWTAPYVAATPLAVSGSWSSGTDVPFGDYVAKQIRVRYGAAPGATPVQETATWRYDET